MLARYLRSTTACLPPPSSRARARKPNNACTHNFLTGASQKIRETPPTPPQPFIMSRIYVCVCAGRAQGLHVLDSPVPPPAPNTGRSRTRCPGCRGCRGGPRPGWSWACARRGWSAWAGWRRRRGRRTSGRSGCGGRAGAGRRISLRTAVTIQRSHMMAATTA